MVIAGVIGGTDSCINENTKTVIFEAASFERSQVRKTSRSFGIRTDSSARFEKGIDLLSQELGMKRALNLICKFNCGDIANGIIDENKKKLKTLRLLFQRKELMEFWELKLKQKILFQF